jgi:hypothetical protein
LPETPKTETTETSLLNLKLRNDSAANHSNGRTPQNLFEFVSDLCGFRLIDNICPDIWFPKVDEPKDEKPKNATN